MSEQYLITGQTLTNIADAIREKAGITDPIMAGDFAEKILELSGSSLSACNVSIDLNNINEKYVYTIYGAKLNEDGTLEYFNQDIGGGQSATLTSVLSGSYIYFISKTNGAMMMLPPMADYPSQGVAYTSFGAIGNGRLLVGKDNTFDCLATFAGAPMVPTATSGDIIQGKQAFGENSIIMGTLADLRNKELSFVIDDWDGEEATFIWEDSDAVVGEGSYVKIYPSNFLPTYHYVYSSGLSYTDDGYIDMSSDDGSLDGLDDNTIQSAFGVVHDAAVGNYYFMFIAGVWFYTYCKSSSGATASGSMSADNCYPYSFLASWQLDPTGYLTSESSGCDIEVVYYVKP